MANLTYKTHDVIIAHLAAAGAKVGLLTAEPSADGTGVVEPNVIYGYTRQAATFGATARGVGADAGKSVIKTNVALVFGPAATQAWPTVTHIGLFDADDDLIAYSPVGSPRTAPVGDAISFGAEAIVFKFR